MTTEMPKDANSEHNAQNNNSLNTTHSAKKREAKGADSKEEKDHPDSLTPVNSLTKGEPEMSVSSEVIQSTIDQKIDARVDRATKAHSTVKTYMIAAMGAGLIPVPLFDLAAISAIQLKMIHSIANQYEVKFSKDIVKSLISSLLGGGLTLTTAVPLASLAKTIPVIGQASGIISVTVLAGAFTYAIGKIFVQHFESGGTFLDFDPEAMRAHFQALFEEGKEVAAQQAKK